MEVAYKANLNKRVWLEGGATFLAETPFDSERKRMTVVYEVEGKSYVLSKGAPDRLLALCTSIFKQNAVVPLDPGFSRQLYFTE